MIGILLPTRGRYVPLNVVLECLSESKNANDLEVIVICDHDNTSFGIASNFKFKKKFGKYKVFLTDRRIYSVSAFNYALENCESDVFMWIADKVTVYEDSIENIYKEFIKAFPDKIGVLSINRKDRANFGMSSKEFVKYNDGSWFWDGYLMNYCDNELTCRAILLGRYWCTSKKYVHVENSVVDKFLLYENNEEKLRLKKIDRGKFYKRLEKNFGLSLEKCYPWKEMGVINLPLKGGIK